MIRHRPYGSEHPYAQTIDQRVPSRPMAGEAVELRVSAARSVAGITCEWEEGDLHAELILREQGAAGGTTAEGPTAAQSHLAAAASGKSGASVGWATTAPALGGGARARYRFHARNREGRAMSTRWYGVSASTWADGGGELTIDGPTRVVPGSIQWLHDADGVHRVRFALALGAHEHVIGFGERYDSLDQRGRILDSVVFEQYKNQGEAGRTYLPMPFAQVLGGAGWAFHVDTARRCWFDVGASDPDKLWVEASLGGAPAEQLTVRFYDGSVETILDEWLTVVGRPEPLPPWVFGLWASSNEWNTQQRVLTEVERHRAEDIPVGVVVIEAWSDESTFSIFRDARYQVHEDGRPHELADFTFPPDGAWPDPKQMVKELHAHDVRLLLWQIPLAKMRPHPTGQARADAAALVRNQWAVREHDGRPYRNRGWWFPQGLMPDLTNPAARSWWLDKRRYLVDEVGIDGFKTDGGEHAWGNDLCYADGTRGDEGNNLFPVHYAAAYGELLTDCGKPPVTFSRAGYTGSQAHGVFWAGDQDSTWEALRSCLLAGLSAAACGVVYWGWDLGGFSGEIPDAELYLRAAALSCFLPIMQYHSEYNHHRVPSRDRTPWNIAERTGDPDVLLAFRRLAHVRSKLVPYLTRQAAVTLATGRPLMRSLCMTDPTNTAVWDHPYQYLLGEDLLIAPVTAPDTTEQPVYLPEGEWVDVWTGAAVTGGGIRTRPAGRGIIPVLCRQQAWPILASVFAEE
jgi:alpha-glucosidase (family GH31 glycosyl hydrolase)